MVSSIRELYVRYSTAIDFWEIVEKNKLI